jgi:hypothetical protein
MDQGMAVHHNSLSPDLHVTAHEISISAASLPHILVITDVRYQKLCFNNIKSISFVFVSFYHFFTLFSQVYFIGIVI